MKRILLAILFLTSFFISNAQNQDAFYDTIMKSGLYFGIDYTIINGL